MPSMGGIKPVSSYSAKVHKPLLQKYKVASRFLMYWAVLANIYLSSTPHVAVGFSQTNP